MTLLDKLSEELGGAFEAAGLDPALARVKWADRPDLAQFQCNGALAAAKAAKKNPRDLAQDIASSLAGAATFREVSIAGPGFINLSIDDAWLARALGDETFAWRRSAPETVVVDYGGPNVAKPLHVGHLRAAIIGESLKRIARGAGDTVIGDAHLGDWGLQMGQLISELEIREPGLIYFDPEHDGDYPAEPPITLADLEAMYPAASAACKADPARAELARKATKALQDGRPGYRALWRHFVDLSVAAMKLDYGDLDVTFDLWKGEADAAPLVDDVAADLQAKGLLERSDGAEIIRVERADDNKPIPPIIFRNSQGAVGYHATDLATILDRVRDIQPDRMLYVVDARQRLHFEQVFRAAAMVGYFPEGRMEHLWFGTMNGKDGKPFKTREGGTLKLRDFIDMVTEKARERIEENGIAERVTPKEAEEIARRVGVSALKFADLSNPRTSDYVFDIDRFTAFEGKTGPYLLYARARIRSVIEKAAAAGVGEAGEALIVAPEERDVALALLGFGDAHRDAYEKRLPHMLCDHAYRLAQAFSKFYAACRITDEADNAVRKSRLGLAVRVADQLDKVFDLLGLSAPDRM
ncbi:MAG: arginine--tRNA ligase [Pseudomonadota bacterium]